MRKFILIFFVVIYITSLLFIRNTHSIDKCEPDCTKCHQATKDEMLNLIKEGIPDVKIIEVRSSPVKGLWEIAVESRGQKGIVYIDSSKKYLISGSIVDLKTKANLTQERSIELNKVDVSLIPLDDALVMGDKDAKYRVIVFDDPD